jgi:plasmid stabilization system protein ParE
LSVTWSAAALADVVRLVLHISQQNPVAARQLGRELLLAGDSLSLFPNRGRKGTSPGTRELTTISPYVIVYEVDDNDDVAILRVWHGAQRRP